MVYVALTGLVIVAGSILVPKIAEQAAALASKLPDAIKTDPLARMPLPVWMEPLRTQLNNVVMSRIEDIGKAVLPMLSDAGKELVTGIGSILSFILIPILSFFFLKDGVKMRGALVESFNPRVQRTVNELLVDLHELLANYIRALVLLSLATFVADIVFLSVIGAPYPVLLALTAAMLELIPVVGPLTAAVIIVLVAAFAGFPHVLWIIAFLALYRMFQDYALSPYLMGAGVEIHPMWVLFGVVAGDQIAGVPGMFFSVPVIAALRLVWKTVRKQYVA
jgi:predicted PurR-regulated permease PerM